MKQIWSSLLLCHQSMKTERIHFETAWPTAVAWCSAFYLSDLFHQLSSRSQMFWGACWGSCKQIQCKSLLSIFFHLSKLLGIPLGLQYLTPNTPCLSWSSNVFFFWYLIQMHYSCLIASFLFLVAASTYAWFQQPLLWQHTCHRSTTDYFD